MTKGGAELGSALILDTTLCVVVNGAQNIIPVPGRSLDRLTDRKSFCCPEISSEPERRCFILASCGVCIQLCLNSANNHSAVGRTEVKYSEKGNGVLAAAQSGREQRFPLREGVTKTSGPLGVRFQLTPRCN